MIDHSRLCIRGLLGAGTALVVAAAVAPEPARAQGKLEATYALTVARLPMGRATATIEVGSGDYAIAMNGKTGGVLRVLSTGEGTLATRGTITDGRLVPTSFNARTKADDDTMDVTMTLEDGSVKELTASAPPPNEDRVEVSDAQKKNVIDPLTALLVPAAAGGDGLSQAACDRTLPIFDGRRRYDLKLAFKRMDKVKSEKGYAGPAVVCAMTFNPVAGHRPSSSLMKFLSGGREMEITFAPMAGTGLLAAYRVAVNNMLGNLVVQASHFEMMPPARASNETGVSAR